MTFRMPTHHGGTIHPSAFNNAIEVYGDDYILVNAQERFRCPRYNAATGDCDPPVCDVCHGLKYIHTYHIHTMYKSLNKEPSYGSPELVPFLFFCKSTSGLKETDRVLEVIWGENGQIQEIVGEYEIKSTHEYKLSKDKVYTIGAASKVKLTTDSKAMRYLQNMNRIGVSSGPGD
jgi:gamma-glutamyl-gamma-aminobutyrate hydrolase PuuD